MTPDQAQLIIDRLKKGEKFSTRFQSESWGISYRSDGRFYYYTNRLYAKQNEAGKWIQVDEWDDKFYDETAVSRLLQIYSFAVIERGLRPEPNRSI